MPQRPEDADEGRSPAATAREAVLDRLDAEDVVLDSELQHDVYPDHPAGYEDRSAWWAEFVLPFLRDHDGVEALDSSERRWSFDHPDDRVEGRGQEAEETDPSPGPSSDGADGDTAASGRYAHLFGDVYWDTSRFYLAGEILAIALLVIPPDKMGEWFPGFWLWLLRTDFGLGVWFANNYQSVGIMLLVGVLLSRITVNPGREN
jgi:hypothetical protein